MLARGEEQQGCGRRPRGLAGQQPCMQGPAHQAWCLTQPRTAASRRLAPLLLVATSAAGSATSSALLALGLGVRVAMGASPRLAEPSPLEVAVPSPPGCGSSKQQ
jgi:hypothetical protein